MADDQTDTYAAARATLRDTAKWYSASLAAFGAALAGGLSFGILPDLGEKFLGLGLIVGVLVFAAILAAIATVQRILFPNAFDSARLSKPRVRTALAPHLGDILPPDIRGLDDLDTKYAAAVMAADEDEIERLRATRTELTSFASFLDLQDKIRDANRTILVLFVATCAGIGFLAYLQGVAKKDAAGKFVPIVFSPGDDWSALAQALAEACPVPGPLAAEGVADKPFAGWWTIRLLGPQPCAGATFTVPGAVVPPGSGG